MRGCRRGRTEQRSPPCGAAYTAVKVAVIGDAASVYVRDWCDGLAGAGATVDLVSFDDTAPASATVHRIPGRWPIGSARYVAASPIVRRIIRRLAPDVVIGYYVTGYGTLATLAGWRPVVQVTAGNDVLVNPPHSITHFAATQNLRRADLVVAFAPHMATAARSFGVDDERLLVLPQGIRTGRFDLAVPQRPGEPVRAIVTRALYRFYRHDLILDALAATPNVTLTVTGAGPDREDIVSLAARLGVHDRAQFTGYVDDGALPALLAQHAVYVSASPSDGSSASLLEAMTVGLVPIVVDHPANREWVTHGENGLLFESGSSDALAEQLARASTDVALKERARGANPQLVKERADLTRNMRRFVDAFEALTRRRDRG